MHGALLKPEAAVPRGRLDRQDRFNVLLLLLEEGAKTKARAFEQASHQQRSSSKAQGRTASIAPHEPHSSDQRIPSHRITQA